MLEIGCATGKATLPLARRGFQITCIELGPDLAVAARRNLDGLGVNIIEGRFEDWQPTAGNTSNLWLQLRDAGEPYVAHLPPIDSWCVSVS